MWDRAYHGARVLCACPASPVCCMHVGWCERARALLLVCPTGSGARGTQEGPAGAAAAAAVGTPATPAKLPTVPMPPPSPGSTAAPPTSIAASPGGGAGKHRTTGAARVPSAGPLPLTGLSVSSSLSRATCGIVFFATPHFGSDVAAMGWRLRHVPYASPAPSLARLTPGGCARAARDPHASPRAPCRATYCSRVT